MTLYAVLFIEGDQDPYPYYPDNKYMVNIGSQWHMAGPSDNENPDTTRFILFWRNELKKSAVVTKICDILDIDYPYFSIDKEVLRKFRHSNEMHLYYFHWDFYKDYLDAG
ncbi:MAG: hypothetical protein CMB80_08075 [Flammeovirgaceae bacterium]|nr:hypothetical protein [Flammeovirgaceae bacterium]|tara:strand:+ start:1532 stop:1861 length:330 start_codon:yes stop_codon:yes gene_type:complete